MVSRVMETLIRGFTDNVANNFQTPRAAILLDDIVLQSSKGGEHWPSPTVPRFLLFA